MLYEINQPDCDNSDKILDAAKGKVRCVLIIGETEHGDPYYSSTTSHKPTMLWMIEVLKAHLLEGRFDE